MKKIILVLLFGLVLIGAGCSSDNEHKPVFNPYKSEVTGEETRDCSSLYPENPYSPGSGHYAGWQWGEKGNYCSGNSQSFIEGCEDFQAQEDDYDTCLSN